MKKILYILSVSALIFATACNPLQDIHDEIDAKANPIVGDAEYTLTDDDYSDLGLTFGNFSSVDDAKSMLPGFLAEKYPIWGKGSSVLVDYKLYVGAAPGVSDYTGADVYSLSNNDYPQGSLGAVGFFPNEDPADYLANILASNVESPSEGKNVLVKYKQYTTEPVTGYSNYFEVDFTDGALHSFEAISVTGDQVWAGSTYGAKMSGYSGGNNANEDWLISPEIDLTSQSNLLFQISQIINYSTEVNLLNVMVSKDYTTGSDPSSATWDAISITSKPDGTNWDPVLSEEVDFSAYEGETIHVALKYESTTETSATWEVESFVIKAAGVEGETMNSEIFYTYSGSKWAPSEGVYFLSDSDFDSMGEAYDQPGYYNNFSSSISPDDYLPTFMSIKYAYGQEDDEMLIIYDYYSSTSGAQLRGNLFTVTDGVWTNYASVQNTTLQFGHDGNAWVPDNTIKYTLTGADYAFIVDNYSDKYASIISTIATYQDFDYNWTDENILDVISGVLLNNFPSSEEGQKFAVTYLKYDGGAQYLTMYVILKDGVYVFQETA